MKMQKSKNSLPLQGAGGLLPLQGAGGLLPLQGAGGLLYDVPWLVREPNGTYMSLARHRVEMQNQAIVDDYFIARDQGLPAREARKLVARKRGIPITRVQYCLRWYYQEAVRRKKYDFLIKFPPAKEHIVHF